MELTLFEKAIKNKIMFNSTAGQLNLYDLFKIPLTAGVINLEIIAQTAYKDLQEQQAGFFIRKNKSAATTKAELRMAVIKRVIEIRMYDEEQKADAAKQAAKRQRILEIIEDKEFEDLRNKDIDELKKLVNES